MTDDERAAAQYRKTIDDGRPANPFAELARTGDPEHARVLAHCYVAAGDHDHFWSCLRLCRQLGLLPGRVDPPIALAFAGWDEQWDFEPLREMAHEWVQP